MNKQRLRLCRAALIIAAGSDVWGLFVWVWLPLFGTLILFVFMSLTFVYVTKLPRRQYFVKLKCRCNNTSSFPYIKLEKASFALDIRKGNDLELMWSDLIFHTTSNGNGVWAMTNVANKRHKVLFLRWFVTWVACKVSDTRVFNIFILKPHKMNKIM